MKKVLALISLVFIINGVKAQQPKWCQNPPKSSTGKFCYICVFVQANEDVLSKALPEARTCLEVGFDPFRTLSSNSSGGLIQIGGNDIQYQRIDTKNNNQGGRYVLMMFTKEVKFDRKGEAKKMPKAIKFSPLAFPMSAIIPGTGQMYKKQQGKGYLFLISTALSGGAGYYFETQRKSSLESFNTASTFDERESFLKEVNINTTYRNISLAVAGTIYLVNIIDALAAKGKRYAYNRKKTVNWNLAYHHQAKAPMAGLTINFGGK